MQLLATLYLVLDPVQQQQLEKAEVIAFSLLAALFFDLFLLFIFHARADVTASRLSSFAQC
jgi:hypothetical protein